MDIPVLISHRTAWLLHHAPRERISTVGKTDYGLLSPTLTVADKMRRIRRALIDCGLDPSQVESIDTMVNFDFERTRASGIKCHAFGRLLPTDHLVELTPGILITDEVFTFALASSWMQPLEQLEFGYEICGSYRMGLSPSGPYSEKPSDTSVLDIKKFLGSYPGVRGFKKIFPCRPSHPRSIRLTSRNHYRHSAHASPKPGRAWHSGHEAQRPRRYSTRFLLFSALQVS